MGASFGSFFGLVIDRFPETSIVYPSSHCNYCKRPLAYRDLVPVFSQLINRFSCRFCEQSVSWWYWLFELLCGVLFLLACYRGLSWPELLVSYTGLVLAIYDSKNQTYPLMVWLVFFAGTSILAPWHPVTYLFLLLAGLAQLCYIPMGAGDFLFLANISLVFSIQEILWVIQISSLLGIAYFLLLKKKGSIPFVPFLTVAFFSVLIMRLLTSP